jgi:hypothetical protein
MVNGMKGAAILKNEDLVCQVLCHVLRWWNVDLGPLGSVCLGDVEDFASRSGVRAAPGAKPRLAFGVEADVRE